MTNYRGISLMSVAVKVLLAILAARLHEGAVGGDAPRLHMQASDCLRRTHCIQQRLYAHIELADQPFLTGH